MRCLASLLCLSVFASTASAQGGANEDPPIETILDITPTASRAATSPSRENVVVNREPDSGDGQTAASQIRDLSTSLAQMIREVDERQRGFSLTIEAGGSLLTPLVDVSSRAITVHFSVQAAYRLPDLAFVVSVENARWRVPEIGRRTWQTAVNIGFGIARYHRSGLLRTMFLVGPSILTRANDLDPAGSVGLYVDLRPLGFSWRFSDRVALVADLLYMTLVAPVLTGVPLIDFQFRSSIGIEASF
ncbi:MAG: hypothetical protein ACI9KE_003915 [Polyangiales bacterium]|jgi:hypothetical protein